MRVFYQESEFIESVTRIAVRAGKIIMDIYNDPELVERSIISKDDKSPLTIADQKASDYICEELQKISDILIICEETKNAEYDVRSNHKYIWLVDPLDGTKEFIKRNGEFTVNIGLAHNGKSVFGVVNIPCQNKTYVGGVGIYSYVLEENEKRHIHVNNNNTNNNTDNNSNSTRETRIVISRSHMNEETKNFIGDYNNPITVPMGSSIKMLLVADGTADIYPRLGPTMEWDTCAAHAVVKGAGGQIYIYEYEKGQNSKNELVYNKENLLNPYFICSA